VIGMPAYRERIPAAELDLIVGYVSWLRESRPGY
jgi:hypothetical protein